MEFIKNNVLIKLNEKDIESIEKVIDIIGSILDKMDEGDLELRQIEDNVVKTYDFDHMLDISSFLEFFKENESELISNE